MDRVLIDCSKHEKHALLMKYMDDLAFDIGKIKLQSHFAHLHPKSDVKNDEKYFDLNGIFHDQAQQALLSSHVDKAYKVGENNGDLQCRVQPNIYFIKPENRVPVDGYSEPQK